MLRTVAVGLGGAWIGAMVGWTFAAFTGWKPAIVVVGLLFGLLAGWVEARSRKGN